MTAPRLHVEQVGTASAGPPLVIAHGLFGSGRNWGQIARRLAADRRVLLPDMRNHGQSFNDPRHGYPELAADLAAVVEDCGERADVLGHSMGGKAAMMLALTRPELVGRLIVVDVAPVAYAHNHAGIIATLQGLALDEISSRRAADAALAPAIPDPGLRGFLLQSLEFGEGKARWRLDLGALAANMPALTGFPETGTNWGGPALFLAGGASDYVRPGHHAAILRLFPAARIETFSGAGHWLHAEQPDAVAAAIAGFLEGR